MLGNENSTLSRRLGALHPPFRLERAVAVGRARGACLRLDAASHDDPGPTGVEAARALAVLSEELERSLSLPVTRRLDEAVTEPSDPREAAAAAAWSALVTKADGEPARRVVSYVGKESDRARFDLAGGIAELERDAQKPIVELVSRVERGQGRLWALFAGSCGTGAETSNDAGEAATLVTALSRSEKSSDVTFEPWIASDGVVKSPLLTTAPSPPPPISPAMTTIDSAKRIVWLTPSRIILRASGSCTLVRI